MRRILAAIFFFLCSASCAWPQAIIDSDIDAIIHKTRTQLKSSHLSTIIFLRPGETDSFMASLKQLPNVLAKKFESFPAVLALLPANAVMVNTIANHPAAMQISFFRVGHEELEFSEQAILLRPSPIYPTINNWWENGYTGQQSIVGLIDSGVATEHPSLAKKNIIVRKEPGSGYDEFKNGVRTAHGTGVACIYVGIGSTVFPNDTGIAQNAPTIITGLAGEGDGNIDDLSQTLSSLDWMLSRTGIKPDVINYSFGNGLTNCAECPDWSGLAKITDYVVNHYHILWVKSAGNGGYVPPTQSAPYASTMSTPADNYNGLTVANMDPVNVVDHVSILNPDRNQHAIRYTSSRGPTLKGRKKPDISAPGNDTRTCAPDPFSYPFSYTKFMDYHDGYRLMGGTSAATPHVGAASLLLHEAGITSPMAKKALLINSADAYTDSNQPGPNDPKNNYKGGHYPVMGSEWNRTYGWGYLNMQKAFEERKNVIEDKLTTQNSEKIYEVDLPIGAKITLVHERRVGYTDSHEWKLSHLSLEIVEQGTNRLIMRDASEQDSVHQVANCERHAYQKDCSPETKPVHALIKIKLLNQVIDGANEEPYALASSVYLPQ